jgi:hypothetical protein
MTEGCSLVRVGSHRAREKLKRKLGYLPRGFWSWDRPGEWREVPTERLAEVRAITGITGSKWRDDLREYISWN